MALTLSAPPARVKASPARPSAPTVTALDPTDAPNDIDTNITITGTGFTAGLSGTEVITQPTVQLGSVTLPDANWISSTRLTATVPWGLAPGVYTLTVANPDAQMDQLPNAFTVTRGLDVWITDGPYGGEIDRVVVHPITQTRILANVPYVGLFQSMDGGQYWEQVTNILGPNHLATNGIAINPSGDIMLAGGSSRWYRNPAGDGSDTWFHMQWLDGWLENPIAHPTSNTVFYAADTCGLPHRSTDGGWTWVDSSDGVTDTTCARGAQLAFDPIEPLTMYLGLANGNIFRSVDGGANWSFASRPVSALWDLAVNPFGDHEVWISTDNRWGDQSTGVLKSTNPDLTAWAEIEQEPGVKLLWSRYIRFAPVTWGAAYSGTVYLPFGNALKKTIDGGATWNVTNHDFFLSDLALYPTDTDRAFTGGHEGVQFSADGGQTWSQMNDGLSAVTPLELAAVPNHPEAVYAVDQGGVYVSERAGESWRFIDQQAEAVATDPFTSSRVYLGEGNSTDGTVYVSDDGGATWPISGVLTATSAYSNCSALVQVLRTDPVTPGRLLAGLGHFCGDWSNPPGSLYLSTDGGQSWSYLDVTDPLGQVNDILFDPQDPAKVYAGTWEGGVFTSTDSGATWHATSNLLADKNIGSLAAEPAVPYRIYAAEQYTTGVYMSDDGGATWTEMAHPPANIESRGLVVVPGRPQVLYAATESGLYRSSDGAQSWQPVDGVLGQVQIHSLAVAADEERAILYVGTGGGLVSATPDLNLPAVISETPVDAGVYRSTTRLFQYHVYLPLVLK
jgi:photosystem II stability/assembly factor-like uncharacterized protein